MIEVLSAVGETSKSSWCPDVGIPHYVGNCMVNAKLLHLTRQLALEGADGLSRDALLHDPRRAPPHRRLSRQVDASGHSNQSFLG
jgi:hypothetical protein